MYTTLALKKGSDYRLRSGHPWVFSNELQNSPKSIAPGLALRIVDFKGEFLAVGYGHPNSLISFRRLSSKDVEINDSDFFFSKFEKALLRRVQSGWNSASFRLIFAEGDGLPGLIIDRFLLESKRQIFVVQSSTAGIDLRISAVCEALESLVEKRSDWLNQLSWEESAVVLNLGSKSRELEGLKVENRRILKVLPEWTENSLDLPSNDKILVLTQNKESVALHADLFAGQKTGFFLDQALNSTLLLDQMDYFFIASEERKAATLQVLDLCSYVGQWGVRLAEWAKKREQKISLTLVDISEESLAIAKKSLAPYNVAVTCLTRDVLKELQGLGDRSYDVVICDPPAFIKKKKDLMTGKPAYTKLNRDALKLVRDGGLFVSCSCSSLFSRVEFEEMLVDASRKAHRQLRKIAEGGLPPDHPVLVGFLEGDYLKAQIFEVEARD